MEVVENRRMSYPNITDRNLSEGFQTVLIYVNEVSNNLFGILLMVAIYIITGSGYYRYNKNLRGAFASAGFITAILATMFRIAELIDTAVLVIFLALSILSVVGLFFPKE